MSLSWPTGLLSPQPKAHTPHPQGIAEESSYSPLLDFFLRNCKRKQKSGLLVRGSVPGGGRHRGASSLPPPTAPQPACLRWDTRWLWTVPVRNSVPGHPQGTALAHPLPTLTVLLSRQPSTAAYTQGWFPPPAWGGQAALPCPGWTFNIHSPIPQPWAQHRQTRRWRPQAHGGPACTWGAAGRRSPPLQPHGTQAPPHLGLSFRPSQWPVPSSFTRKMRTET